MIVSREKKKKKKKKRELAAENPTVSACTRSGLTLLMPPLCNCGNRQFKLMEEEQVKLYGSPWGDRVKTASKIEIIKKKKDDSIQSK